MSTAAGLLVRLLVSIIETIHPSTRKNSAFHVCRFLSAPNLHIDIHIYLFSRKLERIVRTCIVCDDV